MTIISLSEFKTRLLEPLLRGEMPSEEEVAGSLAGIDAGLTLFAAALDKPTDYLFEADHPFEVIGAGRRLAQAWTKARAVLAADGYGAEYLLHCDGGSLLALVHDRAPAERWSDAVARAVASETDLVTVSTVVQPVTLAQLANGLYRAPRTVIGVPGVNDYQERINRYYGFSSPSTVTREDVVAQRQHFGEVVALMEVLRARDAESRQVVAFYESLPFAERCAACRTRPAERLDGPDQVPICGVCLRKRTAGRSTGTPLDQLDPPALLWLEAVGLDRALERQRIPAAYQRLYTEIDEALHIAIPNRFGATVLAAMDGWLLVLLPAAKALDAATSALEAVTLHYGMRSPTTFIAAAVLSGRQEGKPGIDRLRVGSLWALTERMALSLRQAAQPAQPADRTGNLLDLRVWEPGQSFDRFRRPYSLEDARRLITGLALLRDAALPPGAFGELAEQVTRGSAGLYYPFELSKLPDGAQQTMRQLERAWDVTARPGPRFYAMLVDALALARQIP